MHTRRRSHQLIRPGPRLLAVLPLALLLTILFGWWGVSPVGGEPVGTSLQEGGMHADDPSPPSTRVKLIFVHHSTGENWLADENGGLGIALQDNNYFVSDTNYGWGTDGIGDRTDLGNWWEWFQGPRSAVHLAALFAESGQHSGYSRLATDPGGPNEIVLFKSCFPNSSLGGDPGAPPTTGANPLRGEPWDSPHMTVAFKTTEAGQRVLAAALHPADKTVRAQILAAGENPELHRLLMTYRRLTGFAGMMNTSFNLHGYPIVMTSEDAAEVFESSGLDGLWLDGLLALKQR